MGKYYSEHELLNNMYDIVDEDGCILTVLDEDTLKSLPPLMPVRQPVHAHWIINPKYSIVCNCSNCGVAVRGGLGENYCFNCGAKMDEVINDA